MILVGIRNQNNGKNDSTSFEVEEVFTSWGSLSFSEAAYRASLMAQW